MSLNDRMTKENFREAHEKLNKAVSDHGKLEKDLNLPAVFQQAGPWIALAKEIIQNARTELENNNNVKPVGQDLYQCSQTCKTKSQLLELVLDFVSTAEVPNRKKCYEDAVDQENERALELCLGRILEAIVEAVNSGSLIASDIQKNELSDAIKKLTELSAESSEGEARFVHKGKGDFFVNTGSGKQNVAKEHATLYVADNMTVPAAQQSRLS